MLVRREYRYPPDVTHLHRPKTSSHEHHAPGAWGRSQVFAMHGATSWDPTVPGKETIAKPGYKREAARRPVMPQINIKPWNPTGIMQV